MTFVDDEIAEPADEPAADEPAAPDEPAVDEPAVDEPAVDEPADEPAESLASNIPELQGEEPAPAQEHDQLPPLVEECKAQPQTTKVLGTGETGQADNAHDQPHQRHGYSKSGSYTFLDVNPSIALYGYRS
jgi:hypothetical protein